MNNELKEMLQSVLKEALGPINEDLKEIKNDVRSLDSKIDTLSEKIDAHQVANINSDTILLTEIRSIREGVVFVNRKVADAELELNMMKQGNKQ
ncbi:MAG TPA: hypothetical protein GX497_12895 [Bacillus bacterium]|nr:hypothetical protein [Bacillus sp. (in: firmicutes)]